MKHYKEHEYEVLPPGEGRWVRLKAIKERMGPYFWIALIAIAVRALV